jgi:hypothetical protein
MKADHPPQPFSQLSSIAGLDEVNTPTDQELEHLSQPFDNAE